VRDELKRYGCAVEMAFDLLAGKWKGCAISCLAGGTLRLRELERRLPFTSRKVLVQQLRDLEADGIVSRTVHAEVPPRVEYALTARGLKLLPIIRSLELWATEILAEEPGAESHDQGSPVPETAGLSSVS
jgi:DNA-binding HxlR family transcriptional regulator